MSPTVAIRKRAQDNSGFSLVELMVVIGLLAVVGAITVAIIVQGMRASAFAQDRVEALAATQTAVERLSRELRAADPLAVADSDHVEVGIRRDDRYHYYTYRAVADGVRWRLEEERWQFDDPADFDDPGFTPTAGAADDVSERVLIPGLSSEDVFVFVTDGGIPTTNPDLAARGRVVIERLVQEGREPIVVETTVKLRNH